VNAPAPAEYVELQLCREFHCLPSQLRAERLTDIENVLAMMAAEAKIRKQNRRKTKR
jgi:hypothetical protein